MELVRIGSLTGVDLGSELRQLDLGMVTSSKSASCLMASARLPRDTPVYSLTGFGLPVESRRLIRLR